MEKTIECDCARFHVDVTVVRLNHDRIRVGFGFFFGACGLDWRDIRIQLLLAEKPNASTLRAAPLGHKKCVSMVPNGKMNRNSLRQHL